MEARALTTGALVLTDVKQIMCRNLDLNYEIESIDCIVYLGELKSTISGFKNTELQSTDSGKGYEDCVKK